MRVLPTVSIALATYNGAKFLQAQLDSLTAQTMQPCELVVGDDCSSDATLEILEAFAATAPFPVSIQRNATRLDFAENFLRTAMRCTGDYIAFCDQDDVWAPEKLELCVDALEKHGATLCAHHALIVDADLKEIGYLSGGERSGLHWPLTIRPWGVFFGFAILIKREVLALVPMQDRPADIFRPGKQMAHDRWAYFLGSTFGLTICLPQPLVLYRQHGANTFGALNTMKLSVLRKRGETAAAEQLAQQEAAWQKAAVLKRVADGAEGEVARLARAGAAYWRRMALIYKQRGDVATRQGLGGRLLAIAKLTGFGGYAPPARGGLSARALAKDLLVAFSPRTGGTSPPPSHDSDARQA